MTQLEKEQYFASHLYTHFGYGGREWQTVQDSHDDIFKDEIDESDYDNIT